jgi:hypothetical protein
VERDSDLDIDTWIVDELGDLRGKGAISEPHSSRPDFPVGIRHRLAEDFRIERAYSFEGPERMEPGERRTVGGQGDECRGGTRVLAFDEQSLGGVAFPSIRIAEDLHELRAFFWKLGGLRFGVVGNDAPDAAHVDWFLQIPVLDVLD